MGYYALTPCACGKDCWRLNATDRDKTAIVWSYSCVFCGRVVHESLRLDEVE